LPAIAAREAMATNLMRVSLRRGILLARNRSIATSAVCQQKEVMDAETKERIYPRIGDRDVVGFGFNGTASYVDMEEFPCPAIRFGANTPEVLALREKEKGDWKRLSTEDKKALYRASFRETYAEMKAPTGEWKQVMALTLFGMALTGWAYLWIREYVFPERCPTITQEWQRAQVEKMVRERQGIIEGVSSKWDYANNRWKD